MTELALYEIVTSSIGESYVRSYAWAASEEQARELFVSLNPKYEARHVRRLFGAGDPPFATAATDHGWPDEDD